MTFVTITDVRDGLYPSLRQTLSILQETLPENCFKNSSQALQIVADTIGTDVDEIYNTLVDMTYPRCVLPLIQGKGNFGFPPAYHNFSLIKLSDFFKNITNNERIKDFNLPLHMPIPYALVCGTPDFDKSKTKIPQHNLDEVIDATVELIKNPAATTEDLLRFIKGPDLLIGGTIENPEELSEIYEAGVGIIKIVVNLQNHSDYDIDDIKKYCDWYGFKARKIRNQNVIRVSVPYCAFMSNGSKKCLMSLKEILQEFINYHKYSKAITDNELCDLLLSFKGLLHI